MREKRKKDEEKRTPIFSLSLRTGIVRNPLGRDSHPSGYPCAVVPVQTMYGMTGCGGWPLSPLSLRTVI